uniref:hypothetical protein n=1 Tax=Streptomyces griseus TaxID=1911 RepID=UPI001F1FA330
MAGLVHVSDRLPLGHVQEPGVQPRVDRREGRLGCAGADGGHAGLIVDQTAVSVQSRMADLPDALVPVLGGALVDADLRGGIAASDSGRTQPLVLRPTGMPGRAGLAATADTGLTGPSERRIAVHSDCASGNGDAAALPIQCLEEPRLQHLKTHDPRNSLNSRVLRGSVEPA